MSSIVLYIAGGLLLASCLLRIFLDSGSEDEFSNPLGGEEHSIGSLLDTQLSAQLFGSKDWEYVVALRSKLILRQFLKVRKTLALAWVRVARAEAAALMNAHRAAARTSAHLEFFVEVRVALAYFSFLFLCALLSLVIRIRGPVALQVLANMTDSRSERLYEIVGQVFPIAGPLEDGLSGMQPLRKGRH
jgi:hypothetical protein